MKVWRSEMNRRGNYGRFFGRKRGDKKDKKQNNERPSVHTRNLYLAAAPLLFIFSLLRNIAFQLWIVLTLICKSSSNLNRVRGRYRQTSTCSKDAEAGMTSNTRKNVGPGEPVLATQKHHHRKAFEYISKALKIDEEDAGRKDQAIEMYKRGIAELEKGIALDVANGQGESWERARRLQEKMMTNMVMAQERLEILERALSGLVVGETVDIPDIILRGPSPSNLSDIASHVPSEHIASDFISSNNISDNVASGENKTGGLRERKPPSTEHRSSRTPRSDARSKNNQDACNNKYLPQHRATKVDPTPATSKPWKPMRNQPMAIHKSNSLPRGINKNSKINSPNLNRKFPSHHRQNSDNSQTRRRKEFSSLNLKNIDKKLAETIYNEIVDSGPPVFFKDIAGQRTAKEALQEIVILPALRPELFTGLRAPARGLLLFGPPGNGKTMLAKAVANESNATFFNISASSLTSKWVGEGEKLVRTMFVLAKELQPSVVFMDEIDSLLCERREGENDASRRLKTEFLVQFDGVTGCTDDRVLIMGATNRPQELDDAVLRRFAKRVYVTMPDFNTRKEMISHLLNKHGTHFSSNELDNIAALTDGYSGSDLNALAKDAALGPIRDLSASEVKTVDAKKVRDINFFDFNDSLKRIRKSVPQGSLERYEEWNAEYGAMGV
ncbi:hypothetical protein FSP39_015716 [Pinctada imbricata]|uniref:Spastin n=1 Tax=Pinctada imbricata TaxID=66713 RepID=A0AA88XVU4_PINIB|nr:hypothetical protein FSP39_015716 [Pinctada imbricata]